MIEAVIFINITTLQCIGILVNIVMRNFLYEMVLSNNRAADNDVNAAIDDAGVQAIECLIRTCNFIKES